MPAKPASLSDDLNSTAQDWYYSETNADKTMVEVQYGVPQVTYIAAGFVAYVVYLAIFQHGLLTAHP